MNILLLCNKIKNIAATLDDHIQSFVDCSKFNIDIFDCITNKPTLDILNKYDGIIIHFSLWVELNYSFSPYSRFVISSYNGLKVIFMQDENRNVNRLLECIRSLDVQILFTCIPSYEISKVYNQTSLPNVKVINTMTGFVPQKLLSLKTPSYEQRALDVVYRGRKLSAWYGRACYDKYNIARRFLDDANLYSLKADISALETDRIYGDAWNEFLLSSKTTLGVESGASLFDFTGKIRENVERHELLYPETHFDELEKLYFKGIDYNINYMQVSPRHFESAALKTMMVLYEGEYSNILKPWKHYVPLKKDHSNIKEVVNAINNKDLWLEVTTNAYNDIALNKDYTYPTFMKAFDKVIDEYCIINNIKILSSTIKVSTNKNNKPNLIKQKIKSTNNTEVDRDKTSLPNNTSIKLINIFINLKNNTRYQLAKVYWKLDHVCNNKVSYNSCFIRLFVLVLIKVKNNLKLLDIYLRKGDNAKSKFYIIACSLTYRFAYNVNPIWFAPKNKEFIFCLSKEKHQCSININTDDVVRSKKLIFLTKKVKVCQDCKWFIGF